MHPLIFSSSCTHLAANAFCFRGNVEKKEVLENLDLILLCLDEIVDGG